MKSHYPMSVEGTRYRIRDQSDLAIFVRDDMMVDTFITAYSRVLVHRPWRSLYGTIAA